MSRRNKGIKKNQFSVQMGKICTGAFNTMIKAQAAPHFEMTKKGRDVMAYVQVRG